MAKRDNSALILLGLIGAGLFLASRAKASGTALPALKTLGPLDLTPIVGTASAPGVPMIPGSAAVTPAEVSASATIWSTLTPIAPLGSGFINFPSGAQAAAALFQTRTDTFGNLYVQWAGQTYVLDSSPDADGNWPASVAI